MPWRSCVWPDSGFRFGQVWITRPRASVDDCLPPPRLVRSATTRRAAMSQSLRRAAFSSVPSLEASNQAQIDDLVQRNKSLEHLLAKSKEALENERARSKEALTSVQSQWEATQSQWTEATEDILTSWRIVQKQIEGQVEHERGNVIREMRITREEKLARVRRDYKITLFKMNEEKMVRQIEELEDEKDDLLDQHAEEMNAAKAKYDEVIAQVKHLGVQLSKAKKEAQDKEVCTISEP